MKKLSRLSSVLLLAMLVALSIKPAYAASITVAVKQANSNGAAQQVTCASMQQGCVIPLTINAGTPTAQSLNVLISYFPQGVTLVFQAPNGFFYNSDTADLPGLYRTDWAMWLHGNNPATYNITLLQPVTASVQSPPLVATVDAKQATPHSPAATLEITLTPVP